MLFPIIDIARWQAMPDASPPRHFNFQVAKDKVYAIIVKISDGIGYTDPEAGYNWNMCDEIERPKGAYHVFRTNQSAVNQAIGFYKQVVNFGGLGELPLYADTETNDGELSPKSFQTWLKIFLMELDNLSGKLTGIYSRKGYWDKYVAPVGYPSSFIEGRPTWFANYGTNIPAIPWDWQHRWGSNCWELHQKSADGNNLGAYYGSTGEKDIDLSQFNGDLDDFNRRYNLNLAPLPTPNYSKAICLVDNLRIREKPNMLAKIVGYLYKSDSPEVLEEYHDGTNVWLRIGWKQWSAMKYNGATYMAYA